LLPGLIAIVIRLIPKDVFAERRREAESLWTDGKPSYVGDCEMTNKE